MFNGPTFKFAVKENVIIICINELARDADKKGIFSI